MSGLDVIQEKFAPMGISLPLAFGLLIGGAFFLVTWLIDPSVAPFVGVFVVVVGVLSTIRINKQWEHTIILRLGKYQRSIRAGIFFAIPGVESWYRRDMRIRTLDIAKQVVITKDNISVGIDAVVFLKVESAMKSVTEIQDFAYSVRQFSQTTLRNVIGQKELDTLLSKREEVATEIKKIVDEQATEWGIDITMVELQDIELPKDMKRIMARQAEAEREKRAVIIKSEGELKAADNLKKASDILKQSPISFELRKLSTISDVSQDQSNTIIFAIPTEMLKNTDVVAMTALAEST
ncbi:MAG: slipin family protein, partial [Candidatus Geothermarchaeales archaeon]